jgi:hypothetical protein
MPSAASLRRPERRFPSRLAGALLGLAGAVRAEDRTADVIVYGATPGGLCAAIAAAREGASVILLEPTGHVGGLSTGGLSHCDSNQMVRSTLMGLFHEWHTRVVRDYTDRGRPAPYDPSVKDTARWVFEPHVAMRVTLRMLEEAGVTVLTRRGLRSVVQDGPRLRTLVTDQGRFSAKVFVDGSYEGDLLAAAGVAWTIGREGRAEFGESLAGKQYPKPKMAINGWDDAGKLLPLVTTDDAGPDESGDRNLMTYSFRLCLTRDPANRVEIPTPDRYDPARFEIIRRFLQSGGAPRLVGIDLYPLPGAKLDGNNGIGRQFSIGLLGGGNDWHAADAAGRERIWEAHRQYTLEFLKFLREDPAVPAEVRKNHADLGLCRDEFPETGHFPPALYVRESRRMQGQYVLSQRDILEAPLHPDPIAISSFPIDSHDCQRVALRGGGVINEGTIFPVRIPAGKVGYAYHVPYRSILPERGQCDNLLVPVALSCTHVAISSLRIEGAWMAIGQGAGVAAALAAKESGAPSDVPYARLRERLLAQGQVLDLPAVPARSSTDKATPPASAHPGILLDDPQAELTGTWKPSTLFKPHVGRGYVVHGERDGRGDGTASATFRFRPTRSGEFTLRMAYSPHETRVRNLPVTVTSVGQETLLRVDQTQALPAGQTFRAIGQLRLAEGQETVIRLRNEGTTGFIILDALDLLPVSPGAP